MIWISLLGMGAGIMGSPVRQHIVNAISKRLVDMDMGQVFDSSVADNASVAVPLPFYIFRIGQVQNLNYMGTKTGVTTRDFITSCTITIVGDEDKGSAALRAIEEEIYEEFHQTYLVSEGYSNTKIRCLSRGDYVREDDRLFLTTDTFEIVGSE